MTALRFSVLAVVAAALAVVFVLPVSAQQKPRGKKEPVYCTRQYDPVCTRTDKGVLTTFTNACTAKAAGAAVIAKGKCSDLKCPPAELPVCGHRDGKNQTYMNACVAERDGAIVLSRDRCPERCVAEGPQVCAVSTAGRRGEYAGACQAVLAGARVLHKGKCVAERGCSGVGFRVCAISPSGLETQYASQCRAESANASWLHNGKCKPGVFRRLLQTYGLVKPR